ncbi:unnamed protein product [Brugia timori]|uniref:Uncharacterized protein n=1 Tax=Brugia timori TaxID=42155 RepID=A0A0R3RAG0_9BILA|nr:unnamed protein product [Brugia timori]
MQSLSLPSSPRIAVSNRQTPRRERRERRRMTAEDHSQNDESIYEEPPSLSSNLHESHSPIQSRRHDGRKPERRQSHSSTSRHILRDERSLERDSAIELRSNWKQYLIDGNLRQTTGVVVSTSPPSTPQQIMYYSTPAYRTQPPRYSRDKRF